jgi:hypothetical protein
VTPSRIRSRRLGAILATALFTVALVPGLATAADTRSLFIGSPDAEVNSGLILPTPVSVPGAAPAPINSTVFAVQIKSTDNQNLSHTVLTIDANATGNTKFSFNTFYDPDGGDDASSTFCDRTDFVITCDYGSLTPAIGSRTVAVVLDVARDYNVATQGTTLFTARVTTNNENGTNQQTFTADSGPRFDADNVQIKDPFAVSAFGADSVATFLLEGNDKHLFTSGVGSNAGGDLSTDVKFNAANKEIVSINEATSGDGTTGFYKCPTGLNCQSLYSEVSTTTGSFGSAPFFVWTLTAIVPKTYSLSQGFVAHYPTGAKTFDFTDTTNAYWILYFKSKSSLCPSTDTALATKIASAHQCLYTPTLTKFDKVSNKLTVTVVMDHQGGLKY